MLTLWITAQSHWVAFKNQDRGATMVEYALLVILIAIVALLAIKFAGKQVSSTFVKIGSSVKGA